MESETELTQNAALKTLYQKTQVRLESFIYVDPWIPSFTWTVIFFRLHLCWIFYRNCPNLKRIRSIL